MRVLIYSMNYAPEMVGTGKYSGEMAEWLANRQADIRVIAAPPYYPEWKVRPEYSSWLYKKEELGNVSIWRCPVWVPRNPTGLKRIIHLISFAFSSFPIVLRNSFWRPDVIIVVEPSIACVPAALLASWVSRSRCWLHIQDFEIDAGFELGIVRSPLVRKLITFAERSLMGRMDKISTISISMLNNLRDKGFVDSVLFRNWVDLNQIYPLDKESDFRRDLGISASQVVFLYSGNMGEKQGLDIVIEAAKSLGEYRDIVFVMCGQGAAHSRLQNLADGLENVRWLPLQPTEQLNELLNMADVHLLPQRADAADLVMPSKLTGMLASGRAVIATANPGTEVAKVVENVGVVVPAGDLESFVVAIKNLAANRVGRDSLGEAARAYAEQYLSRNNILSEFEERLKEILKQSG